MADQPSGGGSALSITASPAAAPESGSASQQSTSPIRLNARAPEFVPRSPAASSASASPIHHSSAAATSPAAVQVFTPPPSPPPFYAPGKEPHGAAETEAGNAAGDRDPGLDGLSDEVIQKTARQVEYYFSDLNLATTEHLMRFISKDPEGFVSMSVVLAFRKIKGLVSNSSQLAMVLRTSSKLVVSDDRKKVKRKDPFTESDLEELQARIVVAENLPEDHSYQNLMRIFSAAGSVNTIRTCYPQTPNGTPSPSNKSTTSKLDALFGNRLHAFVEFETAEDAEKALAELCEEHKWRSGLRLRLLSKCLNKHVQSRGKKGNENETTGEEDTSTSNQSPSISEKHADEWLPSTESPNENQVDEGEGALKPGRGRGRGGRGRGRVQYYNNRSSHRIGTPPSGHMMQSDQSTVGSKQPPGPRMPDGTRGFTMGRGKPVAPITAD